LIKLLISCCFCFVSLLKRLKITRKKMSFRAREQSREKQADFIIATTGLRRDQLFWTDEVATDKRSPTRPYGRAPIGKRARGHRVFVRGQRMSTLGSFDLIHLGLDPS
jgi:hypothetical protein